MLTPAVMPVPKPELMAALMVLPPSPSAELDHKLVALVVIGAAAGAQPQLLETAPLLHCPVCMAKSVAASGELGVGTDEALGRDGCPVLTVLREGDALRGGALDA